MVLGGRFHTYPKWELFLKEMNDALIFSSDENRDGADKAITFAKVHNPTGFEFWNGGVIVASAPDLIYLKDTNGDDVADVRIRIMHGIGSARHAPRRQQPDLLPPTDTSITSRASFSSPTSRPLAKTADAREQRHVPLQSAHFRIFLSCRQQP